MWADIVGRHIGEASDIKKKSVWGRQEDVARRRLSRDTSSRLAHFFPPVEKDI